MSTNTIIRVKNYFWMGLAPYFWFSKMQPSIDAALVKYQGPSAVAQRAQLRK